jgi:hypothetical protein
MTRDQDRPSLHDCNYGQVLSIWDGLFRTALYGERPRDTGVTDPVVDADNDRSILAMQWFTLKRFWGAVTRPEGWRPGDVGFGPNYKPIPSRDMPYNQTVSAQTPTSRVASETERSRT